MRPVVAVAGIEITDHLQQTRILLQAIFAIKIANGERGGDHFAWIGNTVLFQHLSEFAAGVDDVLHADKIIEQYHPVGAFNWRPGENFFVLQIDDGFNDMFTIQHHHIGGARGVNGCSLQGKGPHRRFIRLVQGNFGKAGIGLEFRRGFNNGHRFTDFRRRERV